MKIGIKKIKSKIFQNFKFLSVIIIISLVVLSIFLFFERNVENDPSFLYKINSIGGLAELYGGLSYPYGCIPNCNGKVCGYDGCGRVCGNCPSGKTCNSIGMCSKSSCNIDAQISVTSCPDSLGSNGEFLFFDENSIIDYNFIASNADICTLTYFDSSGKELIKVIKPAKKLDFRGKINDLNEDNLGYFRIACCSGNGCNTVSLVNFIIPFINLVGILKPQDKNDCAIEKKLDTCTQVKNNHVSPHINPPKSEDTSYILLSEFEGSTNDFVDQMLKSKSIQDKIAVKDTLNAVYDWGSEVNSNFGEHPVSYSNMQRLIDLKIASLKSVDISEDFICYGINLGELSSPVRYFAVVINTPNGRMIFKQKNDKNMATPNMNPVTCKNIDTNWYPYAFISYNYDLNEAIRNRNSELEGWNRAVAASEFALYLVPFGEAADQAISYGNWGKAGIATARDLVSILSGTHLCDTATTILKTADWGFASYDIGRASWGIYNGEGSLGENSALIIMHSPKIARGILFARGIKKIPVGAPTSCFVKGTKILMSDKVEKNIEDIKSGEEVLSWDFKMNKFISGKVLQTWNGLHSDMYIINNKITVSSEHPFWTFETGWASINPDITYEKHGWKPQKLTIGNH